MTKNYFHGRTEAGRSCTAEAVAFAKAWVDAAISLPGVIAAGLGTNQAGTGCTERMESAIGKEQASHLRNLFQNAWKAQVAMVRSCSKGEGVDRHMYGLKCQAQRHGIKVPQVFECCTFPAFRASNMMSKSARSV